MPPGDAAVDGDAKADGGSRCMREDARREQPTPPGDCVRNTSL